MLDFDRNEVRVGGPRTRGDEPLRAECNFEHGAVVPARDGAVTWFHGGALWNEQPLEAQALAFVDALFTVIEPILQSQTGQYGVPDLQLGSQLSTPPEYNYLRAYWSSPTLTFVPFLIDVKQRYDPQDVFRFAQSIPIAAVM